MKKTLVRLLCLSLAILMLVPCFASCNGGEGEKETTTTTTDKEPENTPDNSAEALSSNPYANAGLELMHSTIDKHYNSRTNFLRISIQDSNPCFVWAVGAFIEALAETHRLYPDDKQVKETYIDALNDLLKAYKVENTKINTPNGTVQVTYYNASKGNRGDYYYDDNAWICIQLIEAYKILGEEKYLKEAETSLEFLWTGWDDVQGGGIYWDKSYGSKNACANGPVAIAFFEAYKLTNKEEYLEKGKKIYEWSNEKLLDGNLYIDNIGKNGNKNSWKAAYNQGVFIYAASQLFEITGEKAYYDHAKKVVTATIGLMFNVTGSRNNLSVSMKGNPIYKSWCIGWLTRGFIKYYEIDEKKSETAMTYLEKVLDKQLKTKDKKTGFYDPYYCTGDWGGENKIEILQQSGVISVFILAGYYDTHVKVSK